MLAAMRRAEAAEGSVVWTSRTCLVLADMLAIVYQAFAARKG